METYLPEGSMRPRSDAPASNDIMRAVLEASSPYDSAPDAYYQPDEYYQDDMNEAVDYDNQPPVMPSRNVNTTPPMPNPANSAVVRPTRNPAQPPTSPSAPMQQQRGNTLRREPAPQPPQPPTTYGTPPVQNFAPPPNVSGQDMKPTPPDLWAILRSHEQRAQDEEATPDSPSESTRQPDVQRKQSTEQRPETRSTPPQNQPPERRASSPNNTSANNEAPIIRRRPIIHESTPYQRAIAAEQGNKPPETAPDFSSVGFDPGDLEPDYDDNFTESDPFEENNAPPQVTQNPPAQQSAPPIQAKHIDTPDNTRQTPPRESTHESQNTGSDSFNENDFIVQSIIDQAIPPALQKRPQPENPTERRDERVQPTQNISRNTEASATNPPAVTDTTRPLASTPKPPVQSSAQPPIQRRPLPRFSDTTQAPDVGELPVRDRLDLPTIDGDDGPTEKVHYDDAPLKRISNSPFTYYSAPNQMPQDAPPVHPRGDVVRRQPEAPQSDRPSRNEPPQNIQRQEIAPEVGNSQDASFDMPYFDEGGADDSGEEESSIVRLRRILDDHAQRAVEETSGNTRQRPTASEMPDRPPEADLLQLLNLPPDTPIAGLRRQPAPQNESPNVSRVPSNEYDDADDDASMQSVPLDVALMGGNFNDANMPVQRELAPQAPARQEVATGDESGENSEDGEDLNVDSLARDVLKRLRQRLRIEQERRSKK